MGLALVGVGCSFESEIGDAECENDQAVSEDGTRRCENGYWVRIDAGAEDATLDASSDSGEADEDVDGGADCGVMSKWYLDEDMDGYGTNKKTKWACDRPDGYAGTDDDCDDSKGFIYPGADEECDEHDRDCDGSTDDRDELDFTCGTDEGECEPGTRMCTEEDWSDCMGNVPPTDEQCNEKDDDCDGSTDEGTELTPPDCGKSEGICSQGSYGTCENGNWKNCMGQKKPNKETCNFKDDDCDGDTDESSETCKDVGDTCSHDRECATGVCKGSKCRQVIFVTSTTTKGDFGGQSAADQECINRGRAGIAPYTQWKAVLSNGNDPQDAKDRINYVYPLFNLNGDRVADGAGDLWGDPPNLKNPVKYDELGNQPSTRVWTGTGKEGEAAQYCENNNPWDSTSGQSGSVGDPQASDGKWIKEKNETCGNNNAFYCVFTGVSPP